MWQRFNALRDFGDRSQSPTPPNDGCSILAPSYWRSLRRPWSTESGSLYVPEGYTPSYRYPLICHLHDDDSSDRGLGSWFPKISERNYLAVGVRAPFPSESGLPGSYRWSLKRPDATGGAIRETILAVQENYSIHPDRIYLLGEGIGGVAGLQHFLLRHLTHEEDPQPVQGIICRSLPEDWPDLLPPVMQGQGRLLLCDSTATPGQQAALDAFEEAGYGTWSAEGWDGSIASLINYWVMDAIPTAVY